MTGWAVGDEVKRRGVGHWIGKTVFPFQNAVLITKLKKQPQ